MQVAFGVCSTYAAGVGQEVRADGLDLAVVGLADGAGGLEVLLASPALGQDGQRQVDLDGGHGCGRCGCGCGCGRCAGGDEILAVWKFFASGERPSQPKLTPAQVP